MNIRGRIFCLEILLLTMLAPIWHLAHAQEINNGDWLGSLSKVSSTCAYSNGGSPHDSPDDYIFPNLTLTQNGTSITAANLSTTRFPASLTGSITSSGAATFDFDYAVGDTILSSVGLSVICSGHVNFEFQGATPLNLDHFYTANATYTITLQACDFSVFQSFALPCTGVYTGTITGPVLFPDGPENFTLGARIGGYNLQCTLKDGTTKVSGAQVTALKKAASASEFTTLKTSQTNAKGIATFNIKKLKKGTKVRCDYESTSSKEIRVPILPKN